jgi:5-methylcytosine-specific restriction endonuclease McrA
MNWKSLVVAVGVLGASICSRSYAADFPTKPDLSLTPGKVRDDLTLKTICNTKWGTDARAVTAKMKADVVAAYHFDAKVCPLTTANGKRSHRYEIDHLVPRSLGGADDELNLWPQCYELVNKDKSQQDDGAHKKDQLETKLSKDVCTSKTQDDLDQYRKDIVADWTALYQKTYGARQ